MKMLKIVVFALLALLLVAVRASPLYPNLAEVKIIQLEEACVRQGGLCVHSDECDPSNQPVMGMNLCPIQQHMGVICCYM